MADARFHVTNTASFRDLSHYQVITIADQWESKKGGRGFSNCATKGDQSSDNFRANGQKRKDVRGMAAWRQDEHDRKDEQKMMHVSGLLAWC